MDHVYLNLSSKTKRQFLALMFLMVFGTCLTAQSQDKPTNKGIGPVKELKVGPGIDEEMAKKGKAAFDAKCTACHKFTEKYVGPGLKGVSKKRTPEWLANMMVNPIEMTQQDPDAMELLAEHLVQMTNQNVTVDEARLIIEYFRRYDEKGDFPEEKKPTPPPAKSKKKK